MKVLLLFLLVLGQRHPVVTAPSSLLCSKDRVGLLDGRAQPRKPRILLLAALGCRQFPRRHSLLVMPCVLSRPVLLLFGYKTRMLLLGTQLVLLMPALHFVFRLLCRLISGAMVLDRRAFIDVLTCDGFFSEDRVALDAQSLVTLWRGLPKKTLDPNRTRAPDAARRGAAALDAEYVDVEALFALLGVPWVEETNDA